MKKDKDNEWNVIMTDKTCNGMKGKKCTTVCRQCGLW